MSILFRPTVLVLIFGILLGLAGGYKFFGGGGSAAEWQTWQTERDRALARVEVHRTLADSLESVIGDQVDSIQAAKVAADSLHDAVLTLRGRVVDAPDIPADTVLLREQVVVRDTIIVLQQIEMAHVGNALVRSYSVIAEQQEIIAGQKGTIALLQQVIADTPDPIPAWLPQLGATLGTGCTWGGNASACGRTVAIGASWSVRFDVRKLF